MNTSYDDTIPETKEVFTHRRLLEVKTNFIGKSGIVDKSKILYSDFERTYGKYVFIPFDVPKIVPNDIGKFKEFFYSRCKFANKEVADFISGKETQQDVQIYETIDSFSPNWDAVWSRNVHIEVYKEFPEFFEQIHEYMPWVGEKLFQWNMWSSAKSIPPHRDYTSLIDVPHAMRIKIYDENPSETLKLKIDPLRQHDNPFEFISVPEDTNSFGWNNLRTKHKSIFNPPHRKILFIWRDILHNEKQVTQIADLFDRSIAKYKQQVMIDDNPPTDYLNI